MHQVSLKAKKRKKIGKEICKKARKNNLVPGVIYGKNLENVLVFVESKELSRALTSRAGTRVIIDLEVEDDAGVEKFTTMVAEIQKDIYKKIYFHVDFHKISLDEKVHTEIPIILVGEPKGVKLTGGMLDHVLWSIPVRALPLDLPEKIEADVSHLGENDKLLVKDLKIEKTVEILADPDDVVAIVHPPRVAEAEAAPKEAAEPAEPEPAPAQA